MKNRNLLWLKNRKIIISLLVPKLDQEGTEKKIKEQHAFFDFFCLIESWLKDQKKKLIKKNNQNEINRN